MYTHHTFMYLYAHKIHTINLKRGNNAVDYLDTLEIYHKSKYPNCQ